ncbi:hypothetical protein PAPHI01_2132 [Pancytospora philotis]|nr:hypothetical protein PAPHI01_2132 [Pancytospora philotis]
MHAPLEKKGGERCALDASCNEAFTQRGFVELINEAHAKSQDYYIARAHLKNVHGASPRYYCYDARQLCKYVYEMVISADGRRIRIKNFKDPITQRELSEVNFFRLRYDSDTPLRAEFVGNHVLFLESNALRNKIFYQEDATEALSINFQFKHPVKHTYIKRRSLVDFLLIILVVLVLGAGAVVGIRYSKGQLHARDVVARQMNKE